MPQRHEDAKGFVRLVAFLVIAGIIMAGCDASESPSDSGGGGYTISGKVAYVGSTAPRSGITVRCADATATSGDDGAFELKNIPAGTHTISAEAPGCKPYAASVDVKSDTKHYIYLERVGTTLSGHVSNLLDGPIKGALISVGGLTDVTDGAGAFLISEVPLRPDSLSVTHPSYIGRKVSFTPEGPESQVDVTLQRDSVLTGIILADNYVDESLPNAIPFSSLLYLSGGGTGTIRRHIYIDFEFPAFMRDSQVQLISGSLELCGESGQQTMAYSAFAVTSQWQWYSLSYSRQPTIGRNLATGTIGVSNSPQYWPILNTQALQLLLGDYRSKGIIYGIQIASGTVNRTRSFYSSRAAMNHPRISFKVRF